jgi:hypothetical protein
MAWLRPVSGLHWLAAPGHLLWVFDLELGVTLATYAGDEFNTRNIPSVV